MARRAERPEGEAARLHEAGGVGHVQEGRPVAAPLQLRGERQHRIEMAEEGRRDEGEMRHGCVRQGPRARDGAFLRAGSPGRKGACHRWAQPPS